MQPRIVRKGAARGVDSKLTLSASEIGSYSFCPAAWYQQRMGAPRDSASIVRLEDGRRSHQVIAVHARRAQVLVRMRGLVLLMMGVLLVAAFVLLVAGSGPPRP
jgi:hypothetical protein